MNYLVEEIKVEVRDYPELIYKSELAEHTQQSLYESIQIKTEVEIEASDEEIYPTEEVSCETEVHEISFTSCDDAWFKCNACPYKTTNNQHFQRHLLTHSGIKPFKCHLCSHSTNRKDGLRLHLLTHNKIPTDNESLITFAYKCELCEYKTNKKSALKRHTNVHTKEANFPCNICNLKTTTKRGLKLHLMTHTGEKPYRCEQCTYKTAFKRDLTSHMLAHDNKYLTCDVCGYKTFWKHSLVRHKKQHLSSLN